MREADRSQICQAHTCGRNLALPLPNGNGNQTAELKKRTPTNLYNETPTAFGAQTRSPAAYENTRGTSGVLKVFYFTQFFNFLQGWSSCPLCIRFDGFRSFHHYNFITVFRSTSDPANLCR